LRAAATAWPHGSALPRIPSPAGEAEAAAANALEAQLTLFHAALRARCGAALEGAAAAAALAAALPGEVHVPGLGAPEEGGAGAGGGAPGWEEGAEAALAALLTGGAPPFAAAGGGSGSGGGGGAAAAAAGAEPPAVGCAIPDSSARLGRLLQVLIARLDERR
jgi:hypothetical protein